MNDIEMKKEQIRKSLELKAGNARLGESLLSAGGTIGRGRDTVTINDLHEQLNHLEVQAKAQIGENADYFTKLAMTSALELLKSPSVYRNELGEIDFTLIASQAIVFTDTIRMSMTEYKNRLIEEIQENPYFTHMRNNITGQIEKIEAAQKEECSMMANMQSESEKTE